MKLEDARPSAGQAQAIDLTARRDCSCGGSLPPSARFCPACGTEYGIEPTQQEPTMAPLSVGQFRDEAQIESKRTSKLPVVIGGVALSVAAAAGVAWWALSDSAGESRLNSEATVATDILGKFADAKSTADIRSAATAADPAAKDLDGFARALPADDPAAADLRLVSKALTSVAGLAGLSGESTAAWQQAEDDLRGLDAARDPKLAGASAASDEAADNIDELVSKAESAFKKWKTDNAAAVAARDDAIGKATSYKDSMGELIAEYGQLRDQLGRYFEKVDSGDTYVGEAYAEMAAAAEGRRRVQDRMRALTPPAEATVAHARVLGVIADGIASIASAERGLDERSCDIFGCDVESQPGWISFRSESKRITQALDEAIGAWRESAEAAVKTAQAISLPSKPTL